jgi:hypothetical protein
MSDPETRTAYFGNLPVSNRYTYGLAGERFFREIKDSGRILGTRCNSCNRTYVPAAIFCERCLHEITDWIDMGTQGELVTFTVLHVNLDGSPREKPLTVGFIRFGDGGLIHYLDEIEPDQVKIGMIFEAVFKPQAERQGSILDISYFRPAPQN